jgi:histidine triad (HIT) family protein
MKDGCVFCDYDGPSVILHDYGAVFVIEPLFPVTPGHRLVIPRLHVPDFDADTRTSVAVLACAVRYVRDAELESYNIITSKGRAATQTVEHLHVHIVPRRNGDGLALPWEP